MILWTGDRSGRCLRQEGKGHTSCYVHEKTGRPLAARFERVAKLRFTEPRFCVLRRTWLGRHSEEILLLCCLPGS